MVVEMATAMAAVPCQTRSAPSREGLTERWPSGLRRTLGKRVCGKPYRGFESHSLRQCTRTKSYFRAETGRKRGRFPVFSPVREFVSSPISASHRHRERVFL